LGTILSASIVWGGFSSAGPNESVLSAGVNCGAWFCFTADFLFMFSISLIERLGQFADSAVDWKAEAVDWNAEVGC
jgi:hypothetical protein